MINKKSIIIALCFMGFWAMNGSAASDDEQQCDANVAGQFAYYKLAISRSKEWCIANRKNHYDQCSLEYTVHGLWPQCQTGYPQNCRVDFGVRSDYVNYKKLSKVIPSKYLIKHEWKKHGTCSGLKRSQYFAKAMEFWSSLHRPTVKPGKYTYQQLVKLWLQKNPKLTSESIELACDEESRKPRADDRTLDEIRICFSKDGQFTRCRQRETSCSRLKTIRVRG